jgi:hypothetical protein
MEQELTEIQLAINEILNIKSLLRKKRKSQTDKKRELFISVINSIERLITRQNLMYSDFQLDFANYDDPFLDTIDALIVLHFGKEGAEIIVYYLWDRLNDDGTVNPLMDEGGSEIYLNNAGELWDLLVKINPKYGD